MVKNCFLCGKEAPYYCNECWKHNDALRSFYEAKWGNPLPITHILTGGVDVICQTCYEEKTGIANGTIV